MAYSYFPRDGLGEILGATVVDVENAAEQAETILARRAAETVEGTARGADRQVDVRFRAERNGREWLFGRRIDRREGSHSSRQTDAVSGSTETLAIPVGNGITDLGMH